MLHVKRDSSIFEILYNVESLADNSLREFFLLSLTNIFSENTIRGMYTGLLCTSMIYYIIYSIVMNIRRKPFYNFAQSK